MEIRSTTNIPYLCKYKSWKISDFAAQFGLKHQTASNYFKSTVIPVERAVEVAQYFNITLDDLYLSELTEEYLKSKDPYYINQELNDSTSNAAKPNEVAELYQATTKDKHEQNLKKIKGMLDLLKGTAQEKLLEKQLEHYVELIVDGIAADQELMEAQTEKTRQELQELQTDLKKNKSKTA